MTTSNLSATEINWNLIFITGGEQKLKNKFVRILKKEGYVTFPRLKCFARHCPSKSFADTKIQNLKGVQSTLLQITDEQFGKMQIHY